MGEKIIYSKWLAYELRVRGFKLLRTGINPNFPELKTYIFQDSPLFQQAFIELSKSKK